MDSVHVASSLPTRGPSHVDILILFFGMFCSDSLLLMLNVVQLDVSVMLHNFSRLSFGILALDYSILDSSLPLHGIPRVSSLLPALSIARFESLSFSPTLDFF